ncbi:MAG: 4-(cytidine 5'-diphospho)-2-C-methyl-D-erythritol kinase [Ruminococcus sp.]|nr:4-(cytidine 5'-diphospho)-2-C-methyl-D-erythritol kinase [Ruminococcus sp.]
MNTLTVKCSAKINLALDVTGKLPNGYHTIESVFQTVGLYDEITVTLVPENEIAVSCDVPEMFGKSDEIPCDERNIAFKSAKLFFDTTGIGGGCHIHIVKGIPSQAGMGGGSADASAVLYALNILTEAGLSSKALADMGAKLGADVPFFFTGGTAYVSGIGEKITPIADYSGKILVVAKGTEGVSTAVAYGNIDSLDMPPHPQTAELVRAIEHNSADAYKYFGNLFEEAVKLPEVAHIKSVMTDCGALSALMTGSGSAVFGLFDDNETAEKCSQTLAEKGYFSAVCKTVSKSFI